MRPFTKKSLDNSLCGYKTVKLSEDNSGTEPRVQHLAKLTGMLLALTSKWTGEWRSPMGKSRGRHYSRGSPQWAILLCCNPEVCEESRPDTDDQIVRYEWDDGYLLGKKEEFS